MSTESDTPRTDACWDDESCNILFHARQLEQELNETMTALRNLTDEIVSDEIGRHEGASMMHPRLTRAIAAAKKLITETK
jgi:hypothetical protein